MAVLLEIRNASKRYGDQILLDEASATITDNGKIGFVGRNGAGKSTLLRVILGDEELDSGEIFYHPNLRLGYLRQHDPFKPEETAVEFLMRDSNQPDWRCGEVAGQFELKGEALHGSVQALSGGWQTRVKLAALLLHEPNLLLLDEPTNFLDLRTQMLLEHFLSSFKESCVIVSHDRGFLTATCDRTLDLTDGKLTSYPGKIDAFLINQQEQRNHLERVNAATLVKKRQLERFITKNRAKASTASQARSKAKQLERLKLTDIDTVAPAAVIRCPEVNQRQGDAIRCIDLAIGYPNRTVAKDITIEIGHGTRTAIVGDNGQGKTTFLRTLVASLDPIDGRVRWGYGCEVGTYAQHVYTNLPEKETVRSYLENVSATGTKTQRILDLAGAMLFRGKATEKKINVLSGGERARLCLAGLLLGGFNVLILDEPGNHLDVETVERLAAALCDYSGTVIFTSHDRSFVEAVATSVIEVTDGRVVQYSGTYRHYISRLHAEIDVVTTKPNIPGKSAANEKRQSLKDASADRKIRKQIASLEKIIRRLDDEKQKLHSTMLTITDTSEAVKVHLQLTEISNRLDAAEDKWLLLQENLSESE